MQVINYSILFILCTTVMHSAEESATPKGEPTTLIDAYIADDLDQFSKVLHEKYDDKIDDETIMDDGEVISVFYNACINNKAKFVNKLIKCGADPTLDIQDDPDAWETVEGNLQDTFKELIQEALPFKDKTIEIQSKGSPLQYAIRHASFPLLEELGAHKNVHTAYLSSYNPDLLTCALGNPHAPATNNGYPHPYFYPNPDAVTFLLSKGVPLTTSVVHTYNQWYNKLAQTEGVETPERLGNTFAQMQQILVPHPFWTYMQELNRGDEGDGGIFQK